MSLFWVIAAGVAVLALLSGGNKRGKSGARGPTRIDRPHLIDEDDHECSVCHTRFTGDAMRCPRCGTRFTGKVKDEDEFIFEMDEMEAWDEEEEGR